MRVKIVIYCKNCGEVPSLERDLPVELPYVDKYQPTDTGESPLAVVEEWVNTKCPRCKGPAKRETDTMPNWAGSSWYFLRYIDPNNDQKFADKKKVKYWMPVDWYNGGMEHTNLHLLYSRFWHKFLYDQGYVSTKEPYAKRTSHGVVYGSDGRKMSKSLGNVVNPDEIIEAYGADSFRMYMMFIGPFDQSVLWSSESVMGVRRFLNKFWVLATDVIESNRDRSSKEVLSCIYALVNIMERDLDAMKFNTAVAAFMETINSLSAKKNDVGKDSIRLLIKVLALGAPHMAEELWEMMGEKYSVHASFWPEIDKAVLERDTVKVIVQVNGKMKAEIYISSDKIENEEYVKDIAVNAVNVRGINNVEKKTRCVYVAGRVINFVV